MTVPEADREQVIALLRQQAGEGRLDLDEFGARLDEVYQAQSADDLRHALRELPVSFPQSPAPPAVDFGKPAVQRPRPVRPPMPKMSPEKVETAAKAAWGAHVGTYLSVNVMLIVIWLMTGGGYFWPIWPIMGWGVGIAAHGMAHRAGMHAAERRRRELGRG